MAHILVIRFSAIGDVAMTVPVIYSLAKQYPQHQITVLSRKNMEPLFRRLPDNVRFIGADLAGEHRGFSGINRLYAQLKDVHFDFVADLHHVLRTRLLCLRFALSGVPTASIDKGRAGKRKLVRRRHKKMEEQESTFHRYTKVFQQLGFPVMPDFTSIFGEAKGDLSQIASIVGAKADQKWIGIAPFAKHRGKIYPLELQEQVVAHFAANSQVRVFLFGGGKEEQAVFDQWKAKYPAVTSMIGKLNMENELNLISHLDVMLSMDSANMHFASLVNTPVVSVWGATHPYTGFMGWGQRSENVVQVDLSCRPCSVFGQKPCFRGDYACLNGIAPQRIIEKISTFL